MLARGPRRCQHAGAACALVPQRHACPTHACANRLRVSFTERYPLEPPEFVFLMPSPVHPHIYTNGELGNLA